MKLINKTEIDFIIHERTSLNGNAGDICYLHISKNLLKEIESSFNSDILVEKIIYDSKTKNFINVSIDFSKEKFLNLRRTAGKDKGNSFRLSLDSEKLYQIKKFDSISKSYNITIESYKNLKEIKNSVQKRALSGFKFEKEICIKKGWKQESKSPRLFWEGSGRSWIEKLRSMNFNAERFKINLEKSNFGKWDATDGDNNYEIKKYNTKNIKGKYVLYSEPIIKIAPSESKWNKGNLQYDTFPDSEKYNQFIDELMHSSWWNISNQRILDEITLTSKGIQFEDRFIFKKNIQFSWILNTGIQGFAPIFKGYHRISIVFKILY